MINIRLPQTRANNDKLLLDEKRSPLFLINEIARLSDELLPDEKDRVVSGESDRMVLLEIAKREGRSQLEIGTAVHLKKPTVSVIMKRLEEAGFVYRVTDELDHRATRIYLTEKGKESEKRIRERMRAEENTAIKDLTTNECDMLVRLLTKVRSNIVNQSEK